MTIKRLVTVKQFMQLPEYAWLSELALRHLIFEADSKFSSSGKIIAGNGLQEAGAIIRIGKRVLIDLDGFDSWVESHRVSCAINCKSN